MIIRAIVVLLAACGAMAGMPEWDPITPAEWAAVKSAQDEDCHAIVLFDKFFKDDRNGTQERYYRRMKILDDLGVEHGKMTLTYADRWASTFKVQARTIHPDGTVFVMEDKDVHTANAVKSSRGKKKSTTFILPKIVPGCIIEYMYQYWVKDVDFYTVWSFQEDMPVLRSEFHWEVYKGLPFTYYLDRVPKGSMSIRVEPPGAPTPHLLVFTVSKLPALAKEKMVPPRRERAATGYFFYTDEKKEAGEFWDEWARRVNDPVARFVRKVKSLPKLLDGAGADAAVAQKLEAGYYALQQRIQNSQYLTEAQKKGEFRDLKPVDTFEEMMERGYGNSFGINCAFLAIARQLGLEAHLVAVTDRTEGYFKEGVYRYDQVDDFIVGVKMPDGRLAFFDPGMPFLPFGRLEYEYQGQRGLMAVGKTRQWVEIPPDDAAQNINKHRLKVALAEDSSAAVAYQARIMGQRAFSLALEAHDASAEERKKLVEKWVRGFFKEEVELISHEILLPARSDGPVEILAEFNLAQAADSAGDRLVLMPAMLRTEISQPFAKARRVNPIVFDYNRTIIDDVEITLPAGAKADSLPEDVAWGNTVGEYRAACRAEGDRLVYHREWMRKKLSETAANYAAVKDLYQKEIDFDQRTAVLTVGP